MSDTEDIRVAVAGTGYVGLSLAVLLSRRCAVTAVDIVPEKVDKINSGVSPIRDEYIEKYLERGVDAGGEAVKLNLKATTDGAAAYADADFVIVAVPTNYDAKKNYFDTSAVEAAVSLILKSSEAKPEEKAPVIVIKSTVPVGYTARCREMFRKDFGKRADSMIFSPEFLRESKALYDNL